MGRIKDMIFDNQNIGGLGALFLLISAILIPLAMFDHYGKFGTISLFGWLLMMPAIPMILIGTMPNEPEVKKE